MFGGDRNYGGYPTAYIYISLSLSLRVLLNCFAKMKNRDGMWGCVSLNQQLWILFNHQSLYLSLSLSPRPPQLFRKNEMQRRCVAVFFSEPKYVDSQITHECISLSLPLLYLFNCFAQIRCERRMWRCFLLNPICYLASSAARFYLARCSIAL